MSTPCSAAVAVRLRRSSIVPRSRWTASWPPVAVADRPRRSGVLGTGDQRVVAALAVGQSDRVDRRQVEDVEAELGQPRDLLLDALQAAPGAREQLIPGAEARALAVDLEADRRRQGLAAIALLRRARRRRAARGRAPRRAWRSRARSSRPACAERARSAGGPRWSVALSAALPSSSAPSDISPARSCWPPATLRSSSSRQVPNTSVQASIVYSQEPRRSTSKLPAPADAAEVLVDPAHLGLAPVGVAGPPIADHRAQDVVAVAEDVGGHADGVADAALGGEPAVVDGGLGVLDHDPRSRAAGGRARRPRPAVW